MVPIPGLLVNPVHRMEAIVVIFLLFAIALVCNHVQRIRRRKLREQSWKTLHERASSNDPEVRRKAAEEAWRFLRGE